MIRNEPCILKMELTNGPHRKAAIIDVPWITTVAFENIGQNALVEAASEVINRMLFEIEEDEKNGNDDSGSEQ